MTLEGRRRWVALYVLCLGDLMIVLDGTIVNVALPSIAALLLGPAAAPQHAMGEIPAQAQG